MSICSALLCLCCEHLQRVCCQIDEVVFLICRCFFSICSALSSLSHHIIECVDWNRFVWIKVLFLENHNISYLLYLSSTGMHFGDTWNKCPTLCVFCVFTSFPSCLMCLQITGRIYWFKCVVQRRISLQNFLLYFIFCYIFYTVIICKVYIYIQCWASYSKNVIYTHY